MRARFYADACPLDPWASGGGAATHRQTAGKAPSGTLPPPDFPFNQKLLVPPPPVVISLWR